MVQETSHAFLLTRPGSLGKREGILTPFSGILLESSLDLWENSNLDLSPDENGL